jgi:hypothetical protein
MDREHAVLAALELQPAELGQSPAPDDLDPPDVGERLFAANLVRTEDVPQGGPRLVVREAEGGVPRAQLGQPGGQMIREHRLH